ncbi:5289_t:CDS:2, partial [Cetraspora pellucida]
FLHETSFSLEETHNFNQDSNVQEMIASFTEEMEDEFLENDELLKSDDETEILEEESDKPILHLDSVKAEQAKKI